MPNLIPQEKRGKLFTWTEEEDRRLLQLAEQYDYKKWKLVARNFIGKSEIQCNARYQRIKPDLKKGYLTPEEDKRIIELYSALGPKWNEIAQSLDNRNGKQVRNRFVNFLDKNINRSPFSKEEDNLILKLYSEFGPKWAYISQHLQNRPAGAIKNRYYNMLKKKPSKTQIFLSKKTERQMESIESFPKKKLTSEFSSEILFPDFIEQDKTIEFLNVQRCMFQEIFRKMDFLSEIKKLNYSFDEY